MIRRALSKESGLLSTLTDEDFTRVGKNLNRAKLKSFPTLPKSAENVHEYLEKVNVQTVTREDFLLHNDIESNVIIFSCKSNLEFLCKLEIVMVDGTFTYCTKFFLQMFTILGFVKGKYIPLSFCLLGTKREEAYEEVFAVLKSKCTEMGLNFSPKKVVSDFEKAILSAAYRTFPSAALIGCRFHLSQAWWRKIAALGMTTDYKDKDSLIGKWLHYTFGLTFLPPIDVAPTFVELCAERPTDSRIDQFAQYLSENYVADDSTYPPSLWAALDNNVWRKRQ